MSISEIVRLLAQGINPETGEELDSESIAQSPQCIRMLFMLAGELEMKGDQEDGSQAKAKEQPKKRELTEEERMQGNLEMGLPARNFFRYAEGEREETIEHYENGMSVESIAKEHKRTLYAIACILEANGLITLEEAQAIRKRQRKLKALEKSGDESPEGDADDVGPLSELSCTSCGTLIPLARVEVLPDTNLCAACSEENPESDKPRSPEGFGGSREDTARLRRGYLGDGR